MKEFWIKAGLVVAFVVAVFVFIYSVRLFSNATTPITLHSPKPGVTCATMVTSDGAAISCWKDAESAK